MSDEPGTAVDDGSYDELLGEYFDVVSEIAPLLNPLGIPKPGTEERYTKLRGRKEEIQEALEERSRAHETTDIESTLAAALADD